MKVDKTYTVAQRGVGKPDYSKEVSSALERRGLKLDYGQTLKIFGMVFTAVNSGTHTATNHATIMTDTAAFFTASKLIGLTIVNVTDGSTGIIIANTTTTVTAVLTGGTADQWTTGDVYNIPSPYSWVTTPLAAGGSAHFIDNETGLAVPFTISEGYILFVIEASHSSSEDVELWTFVDGYLYAGMGIVSEGQQILDHRVLGFTTAVFDPTGKTSHTLDVTIKNLGTEPLQGGVSLICIQERVGTAPLPTTKIVQCKSCGHRETLPQETVNWVCPKCGQLNIFLTLPRFRGTR